MVTKLLFTTIYFEECYLNNYLVDNLCNNYNLQRKSGYWHKNQSNRDIK